MELLLFLEDAAHHELLRAVITRVADEEHVVVTIETRNAVGGSGQVLTSLREYVRDLAEAKEAFAEILVVAIDGNCLGFNERTAQIRAVPDAAGFAGRCVCAVPDPHIEVWYLADGHAVADVAGGQAEQPSLPAYKCEPNRYKRLLTEVFGSAGLSPPLGGSEFGDEIGAVLDLEAARRSQESFDAFLAELRASFRELAASA